VFGLRQQYAAAANNMQAESLEKFPKENPGALPAPGFN
jgi:hypothetical protein